MRDRFAYAKRMAEKLGLSGRKWSETAGSHGLVKSIETRLDANPDSNGGDRDKLTKLAHAAGVNPVWLITGAGTPDGPSSQPLDRYPSRAIVVAAAQEGRTHSSAAIAGVLAAAAKGDEDPGRSFWWELLDQIEQELKGRIGTVVPIDAHPDFETKGTLD
jgi:hypothetical protein